MKSKTKKPNPVRKLQRKLREAYAALANARERIQKLANESFERSLTITRAGLELDEAREALLREAARAGGQNRKLLEQIAQMDNENGALKAEVASLKATVGDEQRAAAKTIAEAKWLEGQLEKSNGASAVIAGALRIAVERVDELRTQLKDLQNNGN